MDYLAFTVEALPSVVALTGMALAAFHVRNASKLATDIAATASDAMVVLHDRSSTMATKLLAAAPALLADTARVATDIVPVSPAAQSAINQAAALAPIAQAAVGLEAPTAAPAVDAVAKAVATAAATMTPAA